MGVDGIYTGEVQEAKKVENVYFNLVDNDNYVKLELVDEDGDHMWCGNILHINKTSGKIMLASNVNHNVGFTLDSDGRVIVDQNQNIAP